METHQLIILGFVALGFLASAVTLLSAMRWMLTGEWVWEWPWRI